MSLRQATKPTVPSSSAYLIWWISGNWAALVGEGKCHDLDGLTTMLNRCLAVLVLAEWSTYLWVCGRERELITLLDKGEGQGYAAWKVKPDSESWEQIVSEGLRQQRLTFGTEPAIPEQPVT